MKNLEGKAYPDQLNNGLQRQGRLEVMLSEEALIGYIIEERCHKRFRRASGEALRTVLLHCSFMLPASLK